VLGKGCDDSQTKSLDCVRASRDGSRLAILIDENEAISLYDVRPDPLAGDGRTVTNLVDIGVLEAYVGQDGKDLAYARPATIPKAIDLARLDSQGKRNELVYQLRAGECVRWRTWRHRWWSPYGIA
jgi:hypothetical protein